jgi:hypothetical protein
MDMKALQGPESGWTCAARHVCAIIPGNRDGHYRLID